MLQSHRLVLFVIKYHDFRLIRKFPLGRAKYNEITFFLIFKVNLFAVNQSYTLFSS